MFSTIESQLLSFISLCKQRFKLYKPINLPVMFRLAEQLSVPCLLEARQVYTPLSALVEFRSSRRDVVWWLMILYFSLCLSSELDFNHLNVTFEASSISHSKFAALPTLVSRSWIFFLNTGGTELCEIKKRKNINKISHNFFYRGCVQLGQAWIGWKEQ